MCRCWRSLVKFLLVQTSPRGYLFFRNERKRIPNKHKLCQSVGQSGRQASSGLERWNIFFAKHSSGCGKKNHIHSSVWMPKRRLGSTNVPSHFALQSLMENGKGEDSTLFVSLTTSDGVPFRVNGSRSFSERNAFFFCCRLRDKIFTRQLVCRRICA